MLVMDRRHLDGFARREPHRAQRAVTVDTQGWVPMRLPPPPPNSVPDANTFDSLPTIFSVLGKLGLELKREEDILPVYTVERIERPAAN